MKSKVLTVLALLFIGVACHKEKFQKEENPKKVKGVVVDQKKLPGAKERSFCPQENFYFSLATANNGKLNWTIQNIGSFNQTYWMMVRRYVNGNEVSWGHSLGVDIDVWSQKTINIFKSNEPEDRIFFVYTAPVECPYSWCFNYAGPAVFGLWTNHHPGVWEIGLTVTNGPDTQNYPNRQVILDCKKNGQLVQSIPVRISTGGLPIKHNVSMVLWAEDGAVMNADSFSLRFEDSYPN